MTDPTPRARETIRHLKRDLADALMDVAAERECDPAELICEVLNAYKMLGQQTKRQPSVELHLQIVDACESGKVPNPCTVQQLAAAIESDEFNDRSIGRAVKRLGFTVEQERRTVSTDVKTVRAYLRPSVWPEQIAAQRRLRGSYHLKPAQIESATAAAFSIGELLDEAINEIARDPNARPSDRGALKSAIRDKVRDVWYDSVSRRELAEWLGEDPDVTNRKGLENRTRGLVKALSRK